MKKVRNQSQTCKWLSVCSIVCSALLLIAFVSMILTSYRLVAQNRNSFELDEYVDQFKDASAYLTKEARSYAANSNKVHYDNYWNEVNNDKNREQALAGMQAIGITAQEQAWMEEIAEVSNSLVPLEEKAMKAAAARNTGSALALLYGTEYEAGLAQITALRQQVEASIEQRQQAMQNNITISLIVMVVIVVLTYLLLVRVQMSMNRFVNKQLVAPVQKIEKSMRAIAQGDLQQKLDLEPDTSEVGMLVKSVQDTHAFLQEVIADIQETLGAMAHGNLTVPLVKEYKGEFVQIQQSVKMILDSLNDALGQIHAASAQVAEGSNQVAAGAQELSQSSTEQAASVQDISTNMDALASHIAKIAHDAADASDKTNKAAGLLHGNITQMQEMVAAMHEIKNTSDQIGKIIKTIEDIAFQTNILALNAAVEAARAGAAGKGFAVVADEVRNLANKSAEAAKETNTLVSNSLHAVEQGVKLADNTVSAIYDVETAAGAVAVTVETIVDYSQKQAGAIEKMAQGIDQINVVVQTNSATAQQSAASSEELSSQAALLQQQVNRFQLNSSAMYANV